MINFSILEMLCSVKRATKYNLFITESRRISSKDLKSFSTRKIP